MVVLDNFNNFGWTIHLKNKYALSKTDAFSQIVKSSKRRPNLLGTDDGEEYVKKIFNEFLNHRNIKISFRITALGAVFAEKIDRTICNLLKKPIFPKGNADWLSELPSAIKNYNKTNHQSTKMKPIDTSLKKKEREVHSNLQDKRKNLTQNLNWEFYSVLVTLKKSSAREIVLTIAINYTQ